MNSYLRYLDLMVLAVIFLFKLLNHQNHIYININIHWCTLLYGLLLVDNGCTIGTGALL